MNIRRLNLNLLTALDVLLSERNVTRAGEKLFVSQSAMSNTLAQLRELFHDELLVRGPGGMIPTKLGLSLQPEIHRLLSEVEQLITAREAFDPQHSQRVFRLGMSDHVEFCILPTLLKRISKSAPNIELHIEHMNDASNCQALHNGTVELAIASLLDVHNQINTEPLFEAAACVIASKDNPLMQKKLTMKAYLSADHLRIRYQSSSQPTLVDHRLAEMGKKRHVVITLPHVLPALFSLKNTPLLATLPNFISDALANKLGLTMQALPFQLNTIKVKQAWHISHENDPGHRWLREQIKAALQANTKHLCQHNKCG